MCLLKNIKKTALIGLSMLALSACLPEDFELQERADLTQSVYFAEVDKGLSGRISFDIPEGVGSILIEVQGEFGRYNLAELETPTGRDAVAAGTVKANRGTYPGIVDWLYPNKPEIELLPGTYSLRVRSTNSNDVNIDSEDLEVRIYQMDRNPTKTCGVYLDFLVDLQAVEPTQAEQAATIMTTNVNQLLHQSGISIIDASVAPIDLSDFNFNVENQNLTRIVDNVVERSRTQGIARRQAIHVVMANRIGGLNNPKFDPTGYSMGEPGPYDADRPTSAVLVASEQYTSGGNVLDIDGLSIVVAHEIGHHLGLSHTSDVAKNEHDPIEDTPQCSSLSNCSSEFRDNIMTSGRYSGTKKRTSFTPGQSAVMRRHPLCQPIN